MASGRVAKWLARFHRVIRGANAHPVNRSSNRS